MSYFDNEPVKVHSCHSCGEDIYEGEETYFFDGYAYHEECFEDCAVELLLENGATKDEAHFFYDEDLEYELRKDA